MLSCAALGPRLAESPCDESFDALLDPEWAGEGVEVVGKIRIELSRYRIRGLARIVYSPADGAARIDFRHSSLFGAVEEDFTLLIDDDLLMQDRTRGRFIGDDSTRALVRRETGFDIGPDDMLAALLFAPPRCTEMESPEAELGGEEWRLRGEWRGRRIEMRGEAGRGIMEFKECFEGRAGCYTIAYGETVRGPGISYPKWIRLRREGATERITFELVELKALTMTPEMFETEESRVR